MLQNLFVNFIKFWEIYNFIFIKFQRNVLNVMIVKSELIFLFKHRKWKWLRNEQNCRFSFAPVSFSSSHQRIKYSLVPFQLFQFYFIRNCTMFFFPSTPLKGNSINAWGKFVTFGEKTSHFSPHIDILIGIGDSE